MPFLLKIREKSGKNAISWFPASVKSGNKPTKKKSVSEFREFREN